MSERRFKNKADLDPAAVMALPDGHPAMVGNRTLFPSTVTTPDGSNAILVSGVNNRKLGSHVEKGVFKGYALYSLTLEERATCPADCAERGICYGNGMQYARRNAVDEGGVFFDLLEAEIVRLLEGPAPGLLVRLHVLGDFPSVPYVAFWADMLEEHGRLACYGYTHRRTRAWGGDEIGDAIEAVKDRHPGRFRIRWSSPVPRPDGAVVISRMPDRHRVDEGLVCPAQTHSTGCCATCALCWEDAARGETIAFVRHGRKSMEAAAETAMTEASAYTAERFETDLIAGLPALKAFCMSLVRDGAKAEDLMQETLTRALAARTSFDGVNMQAWLTVIARNHFRSAWRKLRREIEDPEGEIGKRLVAPDDSEAALAARQVLDRFAELPENFREPLMDAALGMSYGDMSLKHGVPEGTVKSRLNRGRERLRAETGETGRGAGPAPARTSAVRDGAKPAARPFAADALAAVDLSETRAVRAIALPPGLKPQPVASEPPEIRHVGPTALRVEQRYQRDLTGKSIALIRRIVENWSWTKFKAPIVVETALGLLVIDGQHTAIAAATHPWVNRIPVLIVTAATVAERAEAFVAHNRDRLAMSPFQVFHGEVVAGDPEATAIMRIATEAGASIPRNPVGRNASRPGQIVPLNQVRIIYRTDGPEALREMLSIAVKGGLTPISRTTLRAIRMILKEDKFAATRARGADAIAAAIAGIPNIDLAAETFAVASEQNRDRACAVLIENAIASVAVGPLAAERAPA